MRNNKVLTMIIFFLSDSLGNTFLCIETVFEKQFWESRIIFKHLPTNKVHL